MWHKIDDVLPDERMGYVLIALTEKGWRECEHLPEAWVSTANVVFVRHNSDKGWFTHWMEIEPLPYVEDKEEYPWSPLTL